jgi:hypothetical protein
MLNDPDPAKRGEIEDGTKKAFLKPQMPGWESGQEGKGAFGPCSRYTLAYVEPRLSPPDAAPTPADEGRGDPAHRAGAANYIVALPEHRRRSHWDRTVRLLLDMADPSEISRQLELVLFYDRQLNLKRPPQHTC